MPAVLFPLKLHRRRKGGYKIENNQKYNIIYADSPWRYQQKSLSGAAEHHYPTMSVKDKGAVTYGLELMMALFNIVQGLISTIMNAAGFGSATDTVLPQEIVIAVEDCGFFESIPLWAVTLIGGLFITVLSFIMIMSVYGRFFKLYLYTAIAPVPLSAIAGEPSRA